MLRLVSRTIIMLNNRMNNPFIVATTAIGCLLSAEGFVVNNRPASPLFLFGKEQWHHPTTLSAKSDRSDDNIYIPPDFTIIDDDDDDGADNSQANEKATEKYVPEDFTVLEAEDDDEDSNGRSEAPDISLDDEDDENKNRQPTTKKKPRNIVRKAVEGVSWMERNKEFLQQADDGRDDSSWDSDRRVDSRGKGRGDDRKGPRTFRQDFRGTRVFVQGLPPDASWQDLKDHFRIAGEVVFASVSSDPVTGESKGHGIVQYETTEMAQNAIATMRNHPLDGYKLYVREDVQEKEGKKLADKKPRGPTPPSKWHCANEENVSYLSDEERKKIWALIKARDDARRRRQYDVSDNIREELKLEYGVQIDDRLKMWWTVVDGNQVPQKISDIKGEGRWGLTPWRQIPTTMENDACVDPTLVNALLKQRDIARREKDFPTADALLAEARDSPDGDLYLRIHDESRTWRIWTDQPPPRPVRHNKGPAEQALDIVKEHAPHKVDEVRNLLDKFPGREFNILKKLKQRYLK